ncbi:alpha/beta-hydrolase [Crassisporium funariophilum]|nr:alpha/beta-hydrolase [Crassisporium funariophilum]
MPYVDLHSGTDYASIFYTTSSLLCNVGGFDLDKPTVVILHPVLLDTTWLDLQFEDARMQKHYNIIAFDMRSCGRSECRPSARHDSWVEAADLAFCFQKLHLPPCHILALEGISIGCALRFAVLFPELCLSLTLINVPSPMESREKSTTLDDLTRSSSFAQDLESFEHAVQEFVEYFFGPECEPDLQDELISFWAVAFPPTRRCRLAETVGVYVNVSVHRTKLLNFLMFCLIQRTPLKADICASITQPVLLIHGEKNQLHPSRNAEDLASKLTGVRDGVVTYTVKGGSSMLSVIPGNASIANKVFTNFLMRLPHHRSHYIQPDASMELRMKFALDTLSEITGRSEIASLDPLCSMSFSCVPPETIKRQSEVLAAFQKGSRQAFSPLTPDGKPMRIFSKREREHWFHGEKGRLSIMSTTFLPRERGKQSPDRVLKKTSRSDFPALRSPQDSQFSKATLTVITPGRPTTSSKETAPKMAFPPTSSQRVQ